MNNHPPASNPPRILGAFAHPDDEVFVAGGTLAKAVAAGADAMVLSATHGQAGQIRDAGVATRRTLGAVRAAELHRACSVLGVQHVQVLDYDDGGLEAARSDLLVGDIVRTIRTFRPDVVVTFGADGAYGHPDHVTISAAVTRACSLAGDPRQYAEQLRDNAVPHSPSRVYHSHFARNRLLLLDQLARWLVALESRFRGSLEFVQSLALFAEESRTLRYADDFIDVRWYPAGFYVVEQGELDKSLYLIVAGHAEVLQEQSDGSLAHLAVLGPGEFFGELAIAHDEPRNAHVVATETLTCLVFSPGSPTEFAGRGASARPTSFTAATNEWSGHMATTRIDISNFVDRKLAAIAAHRSQFPIRPELFPPAVLHAMFDHEYFVRVYPPLELETDIWPTR